MSEELRQILAAEFDRHQPDARPPVGQLHTRHRRRQRGRLVTVTALAAVAVLGGTLVVAQPEQSSEPSVLAGEATLPRAASVSPVESVRTTGEGRGLLVAYVGGACDGPASLQVQESSDQVRIAVVVEPDPLTADRFCAAIGLPRTVQADLQDPLGERELVSEGTRLVPFDGTRLLQPTTLPQGFALRYESGSGDRTPGEQVTSSWLRHYGPEPRSDGQRCLAGPAPYGITQGASSGPTVGPTLQEVGERQVGRATSKLYRETVTGGELFGWWLVWPAAGGTVTVRSLIGCKGDQVPTEDEVLTFARALR